MNLGGVEGTFKRLEIYAGLCILCFAAASFVSWTFMARMVESPWLLPEGMFRPLVVSLAHDLGYLVCAPVFAFAASRLVRGHPLVPVVVIVPGNYVAEEILMFIHGGERVYWELPWGLAGRLIAAGLALSLCLMASRRKNPGHGAVGSFDSPSDRT